MIGKYHVVVLYLSAIILLTSSLNVFSQEKEFPYQLSNADYVWVGAGILTYGTGYYLGTQVQPLTPEEIMNFDAATINAFDRSATTLWNTNLDNIGTLGKYGLFIAPAALLVSPLLDKRWNAFFTYGIMYFETALLTTGITEFSKSLSQRTRPFFYNESLSLSEKQSFGNTYGEKDAFFSGHTSIAFASAVFLSKTFTDIYGKSVWSKVIWGTSLTLAGVTGYTRYQSGQHFPTDIIAGAVIGSAIGYLIPKLHATKESKLGVVVAPNYFNLSYRF